MVDIKGKDGIEYSFHVAKPLTKFLNEKVVKRINTRDKDYVMLVSGYEGSGKSTFASQMAKYVDPNFCLDRMCFSAEEFKKSIYDAAKGECVVYDEAVTGMTAGGSITKVGRLLKSLMMQMRQKNLFVIVVIPSVFELNKYAVLHRAMSLFHVWEKKNRYCWVGYNKKDTKRIYITGKKNNVIKVRSRFNGRFYGKMGVEAEEYKEKKAYALEEEEEGQERVDKFSRQRDFAFKLLWDILKSKKKVFDLQEHSEYPISYKRMATILGKQA